MFKAYRFSVFLLVLLFSACALLGDKPVEPIKSPNDSREYRYLQLPNQLKVLLISDPAADKAAASMDVFAGSRQDPQDYPGLAHFLEHMLFLGTEVYPDAGEYQQFISTHNGAHNAYTSFEHTNYFFDIDPAYLDEALSRFSQFFVAPLFTEDYVDREKNAVHSEYMAKIKDDARKTQDVFKTMVNPRHPFAKFSVGNLDTLSNEDGSLRRQLLAYYDNNYSANIMSLVVIGQQSLAELEQMVSKQFAAIPNKDIALQAIDEPLFEDGLLPVEIQIKPEREERLLSIGFSTPPAETYFEQKPLYYLGNIIGHEGKGSLLSYLKSRGWAEALSAGEGLSYQGASSFNVTVQLTEEGVKHSDGVILALFQALERIRAEGIQQWLFDEQGTIATQQFRYQEQADPMSYVSGLSSLLQYYPPEDVLIASYIMDDFNPGLLQQFLSYLTPEQAFITLSAPELETDQRTQLYDTPYRVRPISQPTLAQWQDAGLNPQILIPAPNEFIANDFDLVKKGAQAASPVPTLLVDQPGLKLWYQQDQQFLLPKGEIYLGLSSPLASDSASNVALLSLYARMVTEQLNEFSYPAYLAGLHYVLAPNQTGFVINIGGFTDKQKLLLDKVLAAIKTPELDEQRFDRLQAELVRQAENVDKAQPYRRLMGVLPELLYQKQWPEQDLLVAYKALTLVQLDNYVQQFSQSISAEVLVYGNYTREQARQFAMGIVNDEAEKKPTVEIVDLPAQQYTYEVSSPYSDSVVAFYLQASGLDKSSRAALGVSSHWLRADFFNDLRTEKQLGYVVTSGAYPVRDVPGMFFLVQSPVAGARSLQNEIAGFIQSRAAGLDEMAATKFEKHRDVLVKKLSEQPKNMPEQASRYWSELQQGYVDFDSRQQLISALEALSFEQWKQFFKTEVAGGSSRGLWLYAPGQFADDGSLEGLPIESIQAFKREQQYYQFD